MFHDIKAILEKNIKQAGLRKQVDAINMVETFNGLAPYLLGQKIAQHTQAIYIRNKILTIQCSSSVIMQEVRYREYKIIRALNAKAGQQSIIKLRYTV